MEIVRIYNNNVVVTQDDDGHEMVAIGKGLAFAKKAGDTVEPGKVEKLFVLKDGTVMSKLKSLIDDMPPIYLELSEEIIRMIEDTGLELNESIYLTLTDHISLSLQREKAGIACVNPLLVDIKQFYRKEFELAQMAAEIIWKRTQVRISEDEIGFITLHIVNASMDQQLAVTLEATRMIPDILSIIEEYFGKTLDTESLPYSRLVRHLQFFIRRIMDPADQSRDDNYFL